VAAVSTLQAAARIAFLANLSRADLFVNLNRKRFDPLRQRPYGFREGCILANHFQKQARLLNRHRLPLLAGAVEIFPVLGVGQGMGFVPVGLACLGQKDERRCVGRLQAEGQIEKYERVDVEREDSKRIHENPDGDHDRLADQKYRRPEKTRERLGLEGKPVSPENRRKVGVRPVESEDVMFHLFHLIGCVP
jgi:hypothetical protein